MCVYGHVCLLNPPSLTFLPPTLPTCLPPSTPQPLRLSFSVDPSSYFTSTTLALVAPNATRAQWVHFRDAFKFPNSGPGLNAKVFSLASTFNLSCADQVRGSGIFGTNLQASV